MRKYIIPIVTVILFIFCTVKDAKSQRKLKYKDVFDAAQNKSKPEAYTLLLSFQKQDPFFANSYFQLGAIAKFWAKDYDPLTKLPEATLFIYNTKLYYGLAKLKLAEEGTKNRELYENSGIVPANKKLTVEEITKFIENQIIDIKEYETKIIIITNYYNKSVESYNKCVEEFKNINTDFSTIKDMLLNTDTELLKKIDKIESNFDSTIYYFNKYKTEIATFPIRSYNQQYQLKSIETFRLDGLTNANFLNNSITLWNYGEWTKNVKNELNNQIKENRISIDITNKELNKSFENIINSNYTDDIKQYEIDKKQYYRIEKYDYNSLVSNLFSSKEKTNEYLIFSKNTLNNPQTKGISLQKRCIYQKELIDKKRIADSINDIFSKNISENKISKYKDFFFNNYNGNQGLSNYSTSLKTTVENTQNQSFENLKQSLISNLFFDLSDTSFFNNKEIKISAKIVIPDISNVVINNYYTTEIIQTTENEYLISGYTKNKTKITGFIAIASQDKKILKLIRTENTSTSNDICLLSAVCSNSYFTILHSRTEKETKNILFQYDKNGVLQKKYDFGISDVPRMIKYDEINDNIMVVFMGNEFNSITNKSNLETIISLNLQSSELNFKQEIKVSGTIFDIIKMDTNFFIFNNFTSYTSTNGTTITSTAGNLNTNIYLTILNEKGLVQNEHCFLTKTPIFGIKASKINSNVINILGLVTNNTNITSEIIKNNKLYYSLISFKGEKIYSNWHD